uniref:Uncharacterized protein n=1 Tax=Meloidogyne hapla TaxID=6305 RepID=A0A1I8B9L7_MELHA
MCEENQTREECFNCNTNYCNKENKVHKQCWVKNKKLCNSSHNSYCFMERNSTNEINKGCDNCSTLACKKCFDHRCNNWKDIPYYCYSFNGTTKIVKECSFTEPDCYIVKINNKDEKQNQFHFNCGKCPASNEDLLNTKDSHLSKMINKTNINSLQCAECNKGPLCNKEELFEKQLFCWEKSENESEMTKMTRICKSECFVYRDLNGNG